LHFILSIGIYYLFLCFVTHQSSWTQDLQNRHTTSKGTTISYIIFPINVCRRACKSTNEAQNYEQNECWLRIFKFSSLELRFNLRLQRFHKQTENWIMNELACKTWITFLHFEWQLFTLQTLLVQLILSSKHWQQKSQYPNLWSGYIGHWVFFFRLVMNKKWIP